MNNLFKKRMSSFLFIYFSSSPIRLFKTHTSRKYIWSKFG